jgi:hypothetical protein
VNGNAVTLLSGINSAASKLAPEGYKTVIEDLQTNKPDLIIKGPIVDFLVYTAALELGIPFMDICWLLIIHNSHRCLVFFGYPLDYTSYSSRHSS